jgi:hypothetical protein
MAGPWLFSSTKGKSVFSYLISSWVDCGEDDAVRACASPPGTGRLASPGAGHLLFLGREGQAPLLSSSSLSPSPFCPNLSHILFPQP